MKKRWPNPQDEHGDMTPEGTGEGESHVAERVRELETALAESRRIGSRSYRGEAASLIADLSTFLALANASIPGIAHIVLNYSKLLTGSAIGYVSTIDLESGDNICHTLTALFSTECRITETSKSVIFPRTRDGVYPGLWGYTLNTRKGFYTNEPARHASSIGLPNGHFALNNFLSVPALFEGRLLGQIAVGNAPGGFDQQSLEDIERLATIYALAIDRANTESRLHTEIDKRRQLERDMARTKDGPAASMAEAHSALELLLKQKEQDRKEAERTLLRNIKELVTPYLEKLEHTELTERQRTYVSIIRQNVEEILSPFLSKAKAMDIYLTPQEMQVASLIRKGYQTKDIAELFATSLNSVNFHRKNIRTKLGLRNRKINLRAFLLSLSEE
ncbi:regulatory protein LuxR [Pseudodesulfovibrio mercurii]|uniref:Regulatory protein LuxR n=1 Tax=Pseudodesulfovibrio mercurii TaxID=641491 RepID=F0JFR6_9BACT|nr:GAF domain-containing protein [Pseudodesulfovibrio mercurii]EGB13744.1 regulatory protein LuxR [Pseudodesulfovibrio mercurii]